MFSCEPVKVEIEHGNDELTSWIKQNAPSYFFIKEDPEISNKLTQVQSWARNSGRYNSQALLDFGNVADAYLVATAAAKGHTLVTYETPDPYCKKGISYLMLVKPWM